MGLVLLGADVSSPNSYRIVCEYVAIEPDAQEDADPATSGTTDSFDLATATIVITHEVEQENGETDVVELASGSLVDGRIVFEGEIDEPLDIKITVPELAHKTVLLKTVITPGGEEISVALVDDSVRNDQRLALVGSSRQVKDPAQKFTISGDLNSVDQDMSQAHVLVQGMRDAGSGLSPISSGNMLPSNGKFLFEGETHEPAVVFVTVTAGPSSDMYFSQVSRRSRARS